ncbi:rod shape-determining protein MreD [Porphyromonas gingivalis]|uniref:rod shape-determining protein MreD n=1 Tax=Porphyromonas gingivalis TaxID=837 RepID=UPI000BE71F3A|nr:rod shape-determining protein MreD [Porphyromonas gingivalis]ATS07337.1 rod shape-determining protein MreD [Porphyromonas gingivalis]PDP55477.1 rod shape-determining protein MreD [Porphyromonas gingivalis]RZQ66745.1 rod shape-determining protein MreD [Porphyromonas gingivalis]
MIREIRFFLAAVLLVLLQVWVFNYIFLFKVATPFVYIYTLMLLPLNVSVSALLWRAFIIGIFLDILSGVPGLHAASLTATAFVRNGLARPFLEKDSDLGYPPSARNLKVGIYVFVLELTIIHHLLLFILDSWGLSSVPYMLLRTGASILLTYLLLLIMNSLFGKRLKMPENE